MTVVGVAHALDNPVVVDGFEQHVMALTPAQARKLEDLAMNSAMVLIEGRRVTIDVVGHADKDARGESFEMEVSKERAEAGGHAIREAIRRHLRAYHAEAELADTATIVISFAGASQRIHETEDEALRKKNRRVVFGWTFAGS